MLVRIVIVLCAPTFLLIFGRKPYLFFRTDFTLALLPTVCKHNCSTHKNVDFVFCNLFDDVITFAHQCVSYLFGAPRNSAPFPGFLFFSFHGHNITYQPFAGTSVVGSMKTLIRRNIAQLITKTTKPPRKSISKACLPLALWPLQTYPVSVAVFSWTESDHCLVLPLSSHKWNQMEQIMA